MARPQKTGVDYFPLDVGFLRDRKVKLLKSEYGANSVVFVLYVLCRIYEENGYFLKWDKFESVMAAEAVGNGATTSYIGEVLRGCLACSLFDERVFNMFGILTSAGIQRRYLRSTEKRDDIEMCEEYLLLDASNKKDVPASILAKLALKKFSGEKTELFPPKTIVISPDNPQSKVKESKLLTTTVSADADNKAPTIDDVLKYFKDNGIKGDPEKFYSFNADVNPAFKDWKQYAISWGQHERPYKKTKKAQAPVGFDLDEFFEAAQRRGNS